jgi:transglutaminase-like putative cysteine protease
MTADTGWRRRHVLQGLGAGVLGAAAWGRAWASERRFEPRPADWRRFEVTTRVELQQAGGAAQVWLPLPSVEADYQQSLDSQWRSNAAEARVVGDDRYGARMLMARFDATVAAPVIEVTSVVRTRDRAVDWERPSRVSEDPATLRFWLQPTDLMPTDGIVRDTAREIVGRSRRDVDKVRLIYDWVVHSTYRDPAVRGCGVGDIKAMLETGNFGGKCGDINALFVGLCRAAGVPARDVYGIRLAPSAFGYRELGGNSASLKSAQHCRAEVFLRDFGWVAMDPADVGKVMRLESPQWLKDPKDPLVAPVYKGLFGGWEGNWMAYNTAHDVALPGSDGPRLGFLMYPQAENARGRYDPLDPDRFKYTIHAREL